MPGQMILVARCYISLVGRGDTGAGVGIPPGAPLCLNHLGSEPPGL